MIRHIVEIVSKDRDLRSIVRGASLLFIVEELGRTPAKEHFKELGLFVRDEYHESRRGSSLPLSVLRAGKEGLVYAAAVTGAKIAYGTLYAVTKLIPES
ncbi:hypothetical protein HQ533_00665 [Candidatus Woesearchaeota archaeon]|nr:hypothetical protein [Candidatus Woesearchaeota archaeon]